VFLGEGGNRRDPFANPLHAELGGLPPMYLQVGGHDVLVDDSQSFCRKARAAGMDVALDIVPGMQHVFQFLAGTSPQADRAIRRAADWARPKLGLADAASAKPASP
jgi:acetyl esterase/lipase